ncbi:MAG: hypothetical protein SVU32_05365 [Candidatus Nanohaloarchaea archaeon]|nr:hypothetical protein [Candidatus Nanohaloarchaea archaeon]
MRKGLSLTIIGGVTLALVGVAVLLGIYSSTYGGSFGSVFCTSYRSLTVLFPGESPPPKGCGSDAGIEYKEVTIQDPETFKLRLGSAIVNCWQQYKGYMTSEELCVGWNVKELSSAVNENSVTQSLKNNNICPDQIMNSQIDVGGGSTTCGTKNQIVFGSNIQQGELIIIKYVTDSSNNQKIKVE